MVRVEQATVPPEREHVALALEQISGLVLRHLADRKKLGYGAGTTMSRIASGGPARLTALAAAEGISQPSMSQLIRRLEQQGLVTRVGDPEDGRAMLVDLTPEGHELLGELRREYRARLAGLLDTLSPEDEAGLALAMHVALPIVRRLIGRVAERRETAVR